MAYAAWSVVAGEQPTAAKWNILGTNDASFNDGTGIGTSAIGRTKIDWSTFSLNMKSNINAGAMTLSNADQDLAGLGLSGLSFTVGSACLALVTVAMGISSTSDFEFRPEIRVGGSVVVTFQPAAALTSAGGRASARTFTYSISLSAGTSVISAGVLLSSATSPTIAVNGASISALVLGNVTA